jgi:hypothetical protein
MSTVLYGFRRDVLLEDQGVAERKSFQSSPQQVSSWIERLSQGSRVPGREVSPKFFEVLSAMLSEDPRYRPTAEVEEALRAWRLAVLAPRSLLRDSSLAGGRLGDKYS